VMKVAMLIHAPAVASGLSTETHSQSSMMILWCTERGPRKTKLSSAGMICGLYPRIDPVQCRGPQVLMKKKEQQQKKRVKRPTRAIY
jgi:hypothetical protein